MHVAFRTLALSLLAGLCTAGAQSLPDHSFNPDKNGLVRPYGLIDLDTDTIAASGPYANCWWGNLMSESTDTRYSLGFDQLTAGAKDLFVSGSKDTLQVLQWPGLFGTVDSFPASAVWSPMSARVGGAGADNTATVTLFPAPVGDESTAPGVGPAHYLFRKLHFRNALQRVTASGAVETVTAGDAMDDDMVVLIHGWNPFAGTDGFSGQTFSALRTALRAQLTDANAGGDRWSLLEYGWETDADTGPVAKSPAVTLLQALGNATRAAQIGHLHGQHLGELINAMNPHVRRVHLIAHSAGAWVARAAAKFLLQANAGVVVQVTLLDPFIPADAGANSSLTADRMNEMPNFASGGRVYLLENYYSEDVTGGTDATFTWRSTDVAGARVDWYAGGTTLDPYNEYGDLDPRLDDKLGHFGPVQFYADTVASAPGPLSTPALENPNLDLDVVGWRRSLFLNEPVFVTQPKSASALQGESHTFTASASARRQILGYPGTSPVVTYTWQKEQADGRWTTAYGSNGTGTYTTPPLSPTDAGHYRVRADNGTGSVDSAVFTLDISGPSPQISITSPAPDAVVAPPVPVTTTVSDAVTTVKFYLDGALAGTVTSAPFSWTVPAGTAPGGHALTAEAYGGLVESILGITEPVQITVGSPPAAPPDADANEPNDASGQATALTNGVPRSGRISSATDVDWFKIDVSVPGMLDVAVSVPAGRDYDAELYGPDATYVAGSYNGAGVTERITYNAATTGTYYIRVYGYPAGNGSYSTADPYIVSAAQPSPAPPGIFPAVKSLNAGAQSYTLSIAAHDVWAVSDAPAWVTVSPATGIGPATVTVAVSANPGGAARTGTIGFNGAAHTVRQAGTAPTDLDSWSWRYPSPQANSLYGVLWNGSQFVAVGGSYYGTSGTVMTSPDAIAWTVRNPDTLPRLNAVAWNGARFVAVGPGGRIYTSDDDGVTWTQVTLNASPYLTSVTWGGAQFVAVGGAGTVLTSPDGLTWTAQQTNVTCDLKDVIWTGHQFLAAGGLGDFGALGMIEGRILASTDGMTWTTRFLNSTYPLTALASNGTGFVAVGGGGAIATSGDGETWALHSSLSGYGFAAVAWGNGQFVAVGGYANTSVIFTSADGADWVQRESGSLPSLASVTWDGAEFITVGTDGVIAASTDGTMWSARTPSPRPYLFGLTWSGTCYVAVGDAGAILTSPDGVSWTAQTSGTAARLTAVTWNGVQFVAVGGAILTSPDGATWTLRSTTIGLTGVACSASQMVAVGYGGKILTSTDGVSWTTRASGTTTDLKAVTWDGSQFVVVGAYGRVLTSPDGIIWTLRDSGETWADLNSVEWNGALFAAVAGNGTILTSADATTWAAAPWSFGERNNLYAVIWTGSEFVAAGQGGTLRTSADGITWTVHPSAAGDHSEITLGDVVGGADHIVAIGNGRLLTFGAAGGVELAPGTQQVVAAGARYPIYIVAPGAWSIDQSLTWARATPTSGYGSGAVTVSVDSYSGAAMRSGTIVIGDRVHTITQLAAPVITMQPEVQDTALGAPAALVVQASGSGLTYQWQKDGVSIAGATAATLAFASVSATDAGSYTVRVTNAGGTVVSRAAELRVDIVAPGSVVAWGSDGAGETAVPAGLADVVQVAAGGNCTVAVRRDGTVVAWGDNQYGQTNVPAGLSDVIAVAAGPRHVIALKKNGTVVAWGYNQYGQTNVPAGLDNVVAIAASASFYGGQSVALRSNGTVVAWGDNGYAAMKVPPLQAVTAIAAGGQDGYGFGCFTLALLEDGTVAAWSSGQFGSDWNPDGQATVPAGLQDVVAIAAGNRHAVALKRDGTVAAWGSNYDGQCSVPRGLDGVTAVAAGGYHSVALRRDGTVVAWGRNTDGQATVPSAVMAVTGIAAGRTHTVVVADPRTAPAIVAGPMGQAVNAGATVAFSVTARGTPALAYQWRKGGSAIAGATAATLTLAQTQPADSGSYDVVVSNGVSPDAVSSPAALNVIPAGVAATHAVTSYVVDALGGSVSVSNQFTYPGNVTNLSWSVVLPSGWSVASTQASGAATQPASGAADVIEWTWPTLPASPVAFTYTLNLPAGDTATHALNALVGFDFDGTPIQMTAKLDPLVIGQRHSADTNRDGLISLLELTRMIELYNTRNGTTRTGCYAVATTATEDGFAPDAGRAGGAAAALGRYHTADENHDGAISLLELTRVIELYNYRVGTQRTGQYHVQSGTEDGFAPGP